MPMDNTGHVNRLSAKTRRREIRDEVRRFVLTFFYLWALLLLFLLNEDIILRGCAESATPHKASRFSMPLCWPKSAPLVEDLAP